MISESARKKAKNIKGTSIFFKIMLAFIILSIAPALFSSILTIITYDEVVQKYIVSGRLNDASNERDRDLYLTDSNIRTQIALIVFLTVILSLFASLVLSRSFTYPIKKLMAGTKSIASGNLDVRLKISSPPEMAELALSFNQMARDLKLKDARLMEEKGKIESIVMHLTDGLIVVDVENTIVLLNNKARQMLGFGKHEDLIGKKYDLPAASSLPAAKRNLHDILFFSEAEGISGIYSPEILFKEIELKSPNEITLKVTSTPLRDVSGSVVGTMRILSDITKEKIIDRMKSEFITIAAHQLRTPLTAIKWAIKLVLDREAGEINEAQENLVGKAYVSTDRIINLVNELLDVSRLEEGRAGFVFAESDFGKILHEAIDRLQDRIRQGRIKFGVMLPEKLPRLRMDKEKMLLVLENLLDNAIKYTPENGKVEVYVAQAGNKLEFKVVDNGIGIPEKDQLRLFTRFFRGTNVMRMQTEGSGLGLYIAKNIIEKHGGEIKINSTEGVGTTIGFILPVS